MTFAFASQFRIYLPWVYAHLALVGAFSVIVKTDGSFAALVASGSSGNTLGWRLCHAREQSDTAAR